MAGSDTLKMGGLALGSVFFTFVVVDLLAGWLLLPTLSPEVVSHPVFHHALAPDAITEVSEAEYVYRQHVNRFGLRGSDIEKEKSQDAFRIIMLGDSFTMGKGATDEKTFVALLDRMIASSDGRRVEIVNGGVESYTPILSYLQLRELFRGFDPDLVVFNLDMSDLTQEQAYRGVARFGPDGKLLAVGDTRETRLDREIRDWFSRNTYFTRLIIYYFRQRKFSPDRLTVDNTVRMKNPELMAHTLASDTRDRSDQWSDIFESIDWIRELAKERGADFALTTYPWGHQVSDTEWVPGRYRFMPEGSQPDERSFEAIEAFARSRSIPFLNATGAFRSYDGSSKLYWSVDMHWTEAGHAVMAEELATFLTEHFELNRI